MRLAFCGLGNMGLPMARRLLDAGHDMTVWNRTAGRADTLRERGAKVAATPREAARGADGLLTMLADGKALEAVLFGSDGAAEGLGGGTAVIDLSTVGPETIRSVARRLPDGVDLLDAPVKGGPARAAAGALRILVGGSEEAFRRWEPVLSAFGTPRRLGPLGTGAAAKVLNNFAVVSLVSVLGEAAALADALGLDEAVALEVLSGTPLAATAERQWRRAVGEAPPSFRLRLAGKDLALAVEAVAREGRSLPVGEAALEWLRRAEAAGMGDSDQATVVRLIRDRRPDDGGGAP